ncbi:MAG: hypothetical protein EG822_02775 [Deltaproteobacteria bacterium]|nr:hypothetical protein [Deltaproteobacteria bacterium]TLN01000.1 MAG: hypothetical protein FDZ73_17555 [bacterium]
MENSVSSKCLTCGSTDIVRNITVSQSVEVGSTGLEYRTAVMLIGTEALLADLCTQCGTVLRLHVKNPDRKWITKS